MKPLELEVLNENSMNDHQPPTPLRAKTKNDTAEANVRRERDTSANQLKNDQQPSFAGSTDVPRRGYFSVNRKPFGESEILHHEIGITDSEPWSGRLPLLLKKGSRIFTFHTYKE